MVNGWKVAKTFQILLGSSLVGHYFALIGLPDWDPVEQEVGQSAFRAMSGVHKDNVMQHDRAVHARMTTSVLDFRFHDCYA